MIITCKACGGRFNNETVPKCPLCNFKKTITKPKQTSKENSFSQEIRSFRKEDLREKRRGVSGAQSQMKMPRGYHISH